jgi:mRNA-degrading endonuclease RelE of RelBE toxin-antitoxin system
MKNIKWQVFFRRHVIKQLDKYPKSILFVTRALVSELEELGPFRKNWKNFGKLQGKTDCFHCHIKRGKPTYVCCWQVCDKVIKIIEVYYVGTHEKVPY